MGIFLMFNILISSCPVCASSCRREKLWQMSWILCGVQLLLWGGSSWGLGVLCPCRFLIKQFSLPFLIPSGLDFAQFFIEVNCLPVLQTQYYSLCITKPPICINCISVNFCKVICTVILHKHPGKWFRFCQSFYNTYSCLLLTSLGKRNI